MTITTVLAEKKHDQDLHRPHCRLTDPDVHGEIIMDRHDLENLKWLNDRINQKLERIYWLKQRALPSAIRYKPDKMANATVFDQLGELFGEIDIEERKVTKLIDKYNRRRTEAIRTIGQLESRRERNILYLRYIAFKNWDEVETLINKRDKCSRRTIMYTHNQALKHLK